MDFLIGLIGWDKIIEFGLTAIIGVIGWRWNALRKAITEVTDVLEEIDASLQDDGQLSKKEIKAILKEAKEAIVACKSVLKKPVEIKT